MKRLAAFIVFAIVGCAAELPTPTVIDRAADSVVSLELKQNGFGADFPTPRAFCSGVVLSQTRILTNAHCVEVALPNRQIWIRFRDGELVKATVLASTAMPNDGAILEYDSVKLRQPVRLRARPPVLGEAVFAVGMPFGLRWTVTQGIISDPARTLDWSLYISSEDERVTYADGPWIQTDAPINPGNSGGALFDADGYLIGITTLHFPGSDNLSFARPVDALLELLKEYL